MLLLLFRLTTPVDQPGQQDASDVKQQKDFHGAHRRAGQCQRGAKRFWNKEAAHSANSGDKPERGGGIRHRFALRLLIAPAAQFESINSNRDCLIRYIFGGDYWAVYGFIFGSND